MAASPPRYDCQELTVVYNPYCNEQKKGVEGRADLRYKSELTGPLAQRHPVLAVALIAKRIAET